MSGGYGAAGCFSRSSEAIFSDTESISMNMLVSVPVWSTACSCSFRWYSSRSSARDIAASLAPSAFSTACSYRSVKPAACSRYCRLLSTGACMSNVSIAPGGSGLSSTGISPFPWLRMSA